jgi:hypothetical protein
VAKDWLPDTTGAERFVMLSAGDYFKRIQPITRCGTLIGFVYVRTAAISLRRDQRKRKED